VIYKHYKYYDAMTAVLYLTAHLVSVIQI